MSDSPWQPFDDELLGPGEELLLKKASLEDQLAADWQALGYGTPKEETIPRMSQQALREFVNGVLDGSLYVADQVKDPKLLQMVFLPLALGGLEHLTKEAVQQIGMIYGPMSSALPRAINGYPVLAQMALMHKDDWARASKAIHRELARRDKIEV